MISIALIIFFIAWGMFLAGMFYEQSYCTKTRHIVHSGLAIFARGWSQGYRVARYRFRMHYSGCVARDKRTGRLVKAGDV